MAERYDIARADERDGKTYWNNMGVMFAKREGDGFSIILKTLFGEVKLMAFPAKPKDAGRSEYGGARQSPRDLDDEVPF